MKKAIITSLLTLSALFCITQSKSQIITRSMFPAEEMAIEITEQLDININLNDSQFDKVFYFYLDWINDVLDEMEYYGAFPMSSAQYDMFCDNGFGYFLDDDNTFGARKAYFRSILTRRQYYRWLALEDRGRVSTTVFIYPFGFPRFVHYNPHVHVHHIWSRPPRPHSYHRHDYRPHPRPHGDPHHHTGHHDGPHRPKGDGHHGGHDGHDGRDGHYGRDGHDGHDGRDGRRDDGTVHRGSFGSTGGNGGTTARPSGNDNNGHKGGTTARPSDNGRHDRKGITTGTTRRRVDRTTSGSTSKKGSVTTTSKDRKSTTTTSSSNKRNERKSTVTSSSKSRKSSVSSSSSSKKSEKKSSSSSNGSSKRGGGSSSNRTKR